MPLGEHVQSPSLSLIAPIGLYIGGQSNAKCDVGSVFTDLSKHPSIPGCARNELPLSSGIENNHIFANS